MKKHRIAKICLLTCLALGITTMPPNRLEVQAAEIIATVQGTILSGTTSDLLLLSTKDGRMEVKMDDGTDASACKILLPGKKIYVSLSHESDGYLHAVKITNDAQTSNVTIDSSTTVTVTGTIDKKTTVDVIYLDTAQGEMEIKFDPTTNISGCSVLVAGENYNVTCARGSDAYMHALSISDTSSGNTGGNNSNNNSNNNNSNNNTNNNYPTVTGTVASNTTENHLYLDTKEGEMQFLIDSNANVNQAMVLTIGNKLTVSFYHGGSDGYLHAAGLTGVKSNAQAPEIDISNLATVKGTVDKKSTQNTLFLDTNEGEMELKLDAVRSLNNCRFLVTGKKLTVTCAYGKDAYMHAIDITGN